MRLRSLAPAAAIVLALCAAASAAPPKREAGRISLAPAAYPPAAEKKGIVGNVVLTGEVTPEGKVAGLTVVASSSPLLDGPAIRHIQGSTFPPGRENGAPVATLLNVVVRFRNDRSKLAETGTMPAPIIGNFALMPATAGGLASGPEGFAVENGDHGIRGELDIDVPKALAGKSCRVQVNDRFPDGKTVPVLDRSLTPTAAAASLGAIVFRAIDPSRREEQGMHVVSVTVDGKNAGSARYRVAGGSPASTPPRKK